MPKRDRLDLLTHHVATVSLDPVSSRPGKKYDVVLCGGRVIDPESGTDAVLNVAIIDDKVAAVGPASDVDPADATATRDCAGCIVCPGFIDLHAHGQNNESARLQACDGVTTHLELEIGTFPVDSFLQQREALGAVINFGSSAGHIPARAAVMGGKPIPFSVANDPCCMVETKQFSQGHEVDVANAAQMKQIVAALGEGLNQGGIGIGAGIVYTPGARHKEIYEVIKAVGKHGVSLFVHIRGQSGRLGLEDFHEMFANAATSGAAIHICHSLSSGRTFGMSSWRDILEMSTRLNTQGIDISLEQYPYPYGMTNIRTEQSSTWNPMQLLRQVKRADTGEIITGPAAAQAGRTVDGSPTEIPGEVLVGGWQMLEGSEFLTEESYHKHYAVGGLAYGHWSDKEAACMDEAMTNPLVLVASDGIPFVDGQAHPRGAGTFSRFLGQYVREKGLLGWGEAIRKVTLGPAQRLENFCPAMRTKGRLAVGCDADITVFDPSQIIDRATLAEPSRTSQGIVHVICNGAFVVDAGQETGILAGRAVRGESRLAAKSAERRHKAPKTTELFSTMLAGQKADWLTGFDC